MKINITNHSYYHTEIFSKVLKSIDFWKKFLKVSYLSNYLYNIPSGIGRFGSSNKTDIEKNRYIYLPSL